MRCYIRKGGEEKRKSVKRGNKKMQGNNMEMVRRRED